MLASLHPLRNAKPAIAICERDNPSKPKFIARDCWHPIPITPAPCT